MTRRGLRNASREERAMKAHNGCKRGVMPWQIMKTGNRYIITNAVATGDVLANDNDELMMLAQSILEFLDTDNLHKVREIIDRKIGEE